jgi:class 3 adenylate cyclase
MALHAPLAWRAPPQGVSFEDRGQQELKGIDEPQRLFGVRTLANPDDRLVTDDNPC